MTDVDQFEFQVKYQRYLSTQKRVSDWVRRTNSQSLPPRKASGSRHITQSSRTYSSFLTSPRRSKDAGLAVSTTMAYQQRGGNLNSDPQAISPTVVLIASSLFICVILPSLLTISAFVVLLTYASSLEAHDSRDESIAKHRS